MTDPKQLKKLAAACRAAGIKHYKSGDIEFTLADAPYKPKKARGASAKTVSTQDSGPDLDPATDGWEGMSDEEKLLWSTNPVGSQ